jgi:phage baseplate assembly protein gpV
MKEFAEFANAVRQQAQMSGNGMAWPRLATISSYDASNHAVKVTVQPVDPVVGPIDSNWMPLGAIGIGNGWGVAVGPQIGDQVMVVYEGGDFSSGTIVARIFSVAQQAPAVPSGEIWALHKTGSFVKLVTNGDVNVNTAGNLNATVAGNMTATVTGNASITAQIASIVAQTSAAITAPLIKLGANGQSLLSFVTDAMVAFFNGHTHTSTSPGTPTSNPNQVMGSGQLTSTVKGG